MRHLLLMVLAVAAASLVACSKPSDLVGRASADPSPDVRLGQIPSADPQKYTAVRNMKTWQNPYLIVKAEGVGLLDAVNHEEQLLKPDELPEALAKLPVSSWPYGRVVAVAVNGAQGPGEEALLRRNRGIVAGTLDSLHILINWVPSS